jgi:two-component system response regulator RegX3
MTAVGAEVRPSEGSARPVDTAVASILLVSDISPWAETVGSALATEGFRVLPDPSGSTAFEELLTACVDVALVDLRLRGGSGLAVCAALRARGAIPLLALGPPGDEAIVLQAYSAGADQYVAVDVSARQLVARVRALLRRFPARREVVAAAAIPAPVEIDPVAGVVVTAGTVVKLSRQELEVLQLLVARPGRVVTRIELMGAWSGLNGARRLDFVIRRLRQKLELIEGRRRISVVRGVGFRFDPDGSDIVDDAGGADIVGGAEGSDGGDGPDRVAGERA